MAEWVRPRIEPGGALQAADFRVQARGEVSFLGSSFTLDPATVDLRIGVIVIEKAHSLIVCGKYRKYSESRRASR